jgi:hypothetical protein
LILLIAMGWGPPDWRPSGAGLDLGTWVSCRLFTRTRMTPHRGGASAKRHGTLGVPLYAGTSALVCLGWQGTLFGHGPHEGHPFACDDDHDLMGVFPAGAQFSVVFTPPHVGLLPDLLDGCGPLFQMPWEMPADLCRVAGGPGAFDQRPTGMAMARVGDAALTPPRTTGLF